MTSFCPSIAETIWLKSQDLPSCTQNLQKIARVTLWFVCLIHIHPCHSSATVKCPNQATQRKLLSNPRIQKASFTWVWERRITGIDKHMGVSKNRGRGGPKLWILIGFSIINHPFWGTPIFGNTHIPFCICEFWKKCWKLAQPWAGFCCVPTNGLWKKKSIAMATQQWTSGRVPIVPSWMFSQMSQHLSSESSARKGPNSATFPPLQ